MLQRIPLRSPSEGIQLAIACLLTAAALLAGVTTFAVIAGAEHERCLARHSDRTLSDLRKICGVRP